MLDILNTVLTTITSMVGFLVHTIETLLSFILHIPQFVLFITDVIAFIPTIFIPFAVASVSIWVMRFLINR